MYVPKSTLITTVTPHIDRNPSPTIPRCQPLRTHNFPVPISHTTHISSIETIPSKTRRTPRRQPPTSRLPSSDRTRQTQRPCRIPALRCHLSAIANHTHRFRCHILQLRCTLPTWIRIVVIGQIHNGDFSHVVATEKRCMCICNRRWHSRHFREPSSLRLYVCLIQFASVGIVSGCICGVVVDDDDGDVACGLQEGENRIVLMGFPAVDEGECCLARYK